jgi:acyl carrier protein
MSEKETEELNDRVRVIVAEEIEVEPEELDEKANFVEDYEADSMSLIQTFSRIERELKVPVPQEEINNMTDLQSIQRIVGEYSEGETETEAGSG